MKAGIDYDEEKIFMSFRTGDGLITTVHLDTDVAERLAKQLNDNVAILRGGGDTRPPSGKILR